MDTSKHVLSTSIHPSVFEPRSIPVWGHGAARADPSYSLAKAGLWERKSVENPHMQNDSMQTAHRKDFVGIQTGLTTVSQSAKLSKVFIDMRVM